MYKLIITILIVCILGITALTPHARAEVVRMDEALTVAENWINLIIQRKGDWGGSRFARVEEIQEFKRGERTLGYFCTVRPQGFIVISLHKALAPVKAYSAVSNLNPNLDVGMTDLIKIGMERVLNLIEEKIGKVELAQVEAVENMVEINYRNAWEQLESGATISMNYQGGEVLLSSKWAQGQPYNDDCPQMNCPKPDWWDKYYPTIPWTGRVVVGCVATAGAQIMRYWNWPPYGAGSPYNDSYDWVNMPNELSPNSNQDQIDAVAELCYEVGVAAKMEYGCDGSGTNMADMESAYKGNFRYSDNPLFGCIMVYRKDGYSTTEWFDKIKIQLNVNRPIQYAIAEKSKFNEKKTGQSGEIEGHSIVADGWQIVGYPPQMQIHMNYGWGGNTDSWYTLDSLPGSNIVDDNMIIGIKPTVCAILPIYGGIIPRQSFPYRYFDLDTVASNATFESGQYLQFLPGIKVICTGGSTKFYGSSSANTRLFSFTRRVPSKGIQDTSRGIRIYSGAIKMNANGAIKFPK